MFRKIFLTMFEMWIGIIDLEKLVLFQNLREHFPYNSQNKREVNNIQIFAIFKERSLKFSTFTQNFCNSKDRT